MLLSQRSIRLHNDVEHFLMRTVVNLIIYHKNIDSDLRTGQKMPYRLLQILGNCVLMNQVPKGQTMAVNFGVRARQLLSFFWKVISGTKISTIVTVK